MRAQLRAALVMLATLTLITGVLYPLVVTGIGRMLFARQVSGNMIVEDGHVVGSSLIGQTFTDARYFWGRLSATGPFPDNPAASSGSNLGPSNPALLAATRARLDALRRNDPRADASVPGDLVTASGSGLDPHISPAAAEYQVARVAGARRLSAEAVRGLVRAHTEGRTFGVLGEPRVNVLELNLALDGAFAKRAGR